MGRKTDSSKFHGNRVNEEFARTSNQRVRNYLRRKMKRMGVQRADFITDHKPMVFEGTFRTK